MVYYLNKVLRGSLVVLSGISIHFVALGNNTAESASYFVAVTGNDDNPGTPDRPWRNPQKCVSFGTPLTAGDTCLIGDGVYSANGPVVYVRKNSPAGTATSPITLKSQNRFGAVIEVPSVTDPNKNFGFYITQPYYIIEGFDIRGTTNTVSNNHHGISAKSATGIIIRKNKIHNIGRTVCSTVLSAENGIVGLGDDAIVEDNLFYTIGSLRNRENGGSTTKSQVLDHAIYISNFSNVTIRRNIFFDVNRGYALHVYTGSGSTVNGLFVYNNVFADRSITNSPAAQILLAHTLSNVQIKNNIFYGPANTKGYGIGFYNTKTIQNVVLSHNLMNGTASTLINEYRKPVSGVTEDANNNYNTDPAFMNAELHDYRLTATSPAIDKGTPVGLPFKGKAPDIGAYEFSEQNEASPRSPNELQID